MRKKEWQKLVPSGMRQKCDRWAQDEFLVGAVVVVEKLVAAMSFNGRRGVVTGRKDGTDRFYVDFGNNDHDSALRPANLRWVACGIYVKVVPVTVAAAAAAAATFIIRAGAAVPISATLAGACAAFVANKKAHTAESSARRQELDASMGYDMLDALGASLERKAEGDSGGGRVRFLACTDDGDDLSDDEPTDLAAAQTRAAMLGGGVGVGRGGAVPTGIKKGWKE